MVGDDVVISCCREKHLCEVLSLPVPQTDTGSQVEYTEESERIVAKELGKMSP